MPHRLSASVNWLGWISASVNDLAGIPRVISAIRREFEKATG